MTEINWYLAIKVWFVYSINQHEWGDTSTRKYNTGQPSVNHQKCELMKKISIYNILRQAFYKWISDKKLCGQRICQNIGIEWFFIRPWI